MNKLERWARGKQPGSIASASALGVFLPGMQERMKVRADIEAARIQLAMVTWDSPTADAEVARRAELFAKIRRGSPRSGPNPQLAALQSVYRDATLGLLD